MQVKIPSFALAQKILLDFVAHPDKMGPSKENKMIQYFENLEIGTSVGFDEMPDNLEWGTKGTVTHCFSREDFGRYFILTIAENGANILFEDGNSWSECGKYKLHDQFRWDRDKKK